MDHKKQFETMAIIRAYAAQIAAESSVDCTEVRAKIYFDRISRMFELASSLESPTLASEIARAREALVAEHD